MKEERVGSVWRWRAGQVAVCLVVLASAAAAGFFARSRRQGIATGPISVAEESLDFGETWAQPGFEWTLPLHNPTASDIEIVQVRTSCHCVSVSPQSMRIPAGHTVPLRLVLDLTTNDSEAAARPSRPFDVELVPTVRGHASGKVRWRVAGRVRRYPLATSPTSVDFGQTLVEGSPFPSRHVDVDCFERIASLAAECDESLATVQVTSQDERADRLVLTISPRSDLARGEYDLAVTLKPVLAGGEQALEVPPLLLPASFRVSGGVHAAPTSLMLGAAKVGGTLEDIVAFSSTTEGFVVSPVERVAGDWPAVVPLDGREDGIQLFRVSQRVGKVGSQQDEVAFVVREEGVDEPYEVSIPLYYHGLPK